MSRQIDFGWRIFVIAKKVYDRPVLALDQLLFVKSFLGKLSIRFQARLFGGQAEIGPRISIDCPIQFKGSGCLVIEDNVQLGYRSGGSSRVPIMFQPRVPSSLIYVGEGTAIMNGCEFISKQSISIGRNCRIGARCAMLDSDFHGIRIGQRDQAGETQPIKIGNNVWMGREVLVLKGVHIGNNAVIGARCVIAKNVPEGSIVVGAKNRVIGTVYD